MSEKSTGEDNREGISITDIFHVMRQYPTWMLALPMVFAGGTLLVATMMSPVWEVTALVRIGQVGSIFKDSGDDYNYKTDLLDSSEQVVGQLKAISFMKEVFSNTNPATSSADFSLYADTLKAKALSKSNLVEFKFRAYSPDKAKELAIATVERLAKTHNRKLNPIVNGLKERLHQTEEQLSKVAFTSRESQQFMVAAKDTHGVLLAAKLILDQQLRTRDLESQRLILQEVISISSPTTFESPLYISPSPVSPNKLLMAVVAFMVGAIFAVVGAVWRAKRQGKI